MELPDQPRALRVLVADSHRDTVDSLALLLSLWGHQPLLAYDGPAALGAALSQPPDVLLAELKLAALDGYELARRLRRQPRLDTMLLVACTGYARDADRVRSKEAGFDHHLVKPVDPEELRQLLDAFARLVWLRESGHLHDGAMPPTTTPLQRHDVRYTLAEGEPACTTGHSEGSGR
jgi:CheY-like chemotaxis protein